MNDDEKMKRLTERIIELESTLYCIWERIDFENQDRSCQVCKRMEPIDGVITHASDCIILTLPQYPEWAK